MSLSSEIMGEKRVFKSGEPNSPASEPEHLQCPRCESTNTKFCYYNNYNLSQPRYFCKGCRRYWTRGGSLRNIPIGGGSRKNSKRSRTETPTKTENVNPNPTPVTPLSPFRCSDVNLNEAVPGSFSSLLGSQTGSGFLGLSGYSLGLGNGSSSGFDMLGFGFSTVAEIGGGNTWQMEGGDGGAVTDGGDCFGWPELAISTPGTAGLE